MSKLVVVQASLFHRPPAEAPRYDPLQGSVAISGALVYFDDVAGMSAACAPRPPAEIATLAAKLKPMKLRTTKLLKLM